MEKKKFKLPLMDSMIKHEKSMADSMAWLRAVTFVGFSLLFFPFAFYLIIFDSVGMVYERAFNYALWAGGFTTAVIVMAYNVHINRKK